MNAAHRNIHDKQDRFEAIKTGYEWGMFQHQQEVEDFLAWLRLTLPGGRELGHVVEIGAHRGGTTAMFCALSAGRVLSIDLPLGPWGGVGLDYATARNDKLLEHYPHFNAILGDSHNPSICAQAQQTLCEVDLLFIDGDHSHFGVRTDFVDYKWMVRKGGVIAFHDINDTQYHRDRGVMVAAFFKELENSYDLNRFTINAEWGGIGAIIKG